MLRPQLKTPLFDHVQAYQSAGGQIQPAVNTGKITSGDEAEKVRARKQSARLQSKKNKGGICE